MKGLNMPALPNDVVEFFDTTVPVRRLGARVQLFGQYLPPRSKQCLHYPFDTHHHGWVVLGAWSRADAVLQEMATRLEWDPFRSDPSEVDLRKYYVSLHEAFKMASTHYQSISADPNVMGGAPCIRGTRIPVYMVLGAIEHYGEVEAAIRAYPRLTLQQVRDAIGFAKLVVECPIDDETSPAS
jgi:uncharacterized protein (DUF433 family)